MYGDAGKDEGNHRRDHEEEAVNNRSDAYFSEARTGEDAYEEEEDRDLGEDDGGDVGELCYPSVLGGL